MLYITVTFDGHADTVYTCLVRLPTLVIYINCLYCLRRVIVARNIFLQKPLFFVSRSFISKRRHTSFSMQRRGNFHTRKWFIIIDGMHVCSRIIVITVYVCEGELRAHAHTVTFATVLAATCRICFLFTTRFLKLFGIFNWQWLFPLDAVKLTDIHSNRVVVVESVVWRHHVVVRIRFLPREKLNLFFIQPLSPRKAMAD